MNLATIQTTFRGEIAADDDQAPPSSPGMAIYREAYRGRLLAALETSFERTRQWVGEESFTAAACHYILTHPPLGWTLDDFGHAFPDLLAELFAADREVAELAWLEWQMSKAFAAPDLPVLDAQTLAAAGHVAQDWDAMRLAMANGFAGRWVASNCIDIWQALHRGDDPPSPISLNDRCFLIVWRAGMSPHFRLAEPSEGVILERLVAGAPLGEVAMLAPPEELGAMLALWLSEGLLSGATN